METSVMQEIAVAAKWWADRLRTPARQDNGEPMHNALMALLQAQAPRPTPEQADAFEAALSRRMGELEWRWKEELKIVGVDYDPDRMLSEALEEAGLCNEITALPVKTVMWIRPGRVEVKYGYGQPIETLYPSVMRG